MNQEKFCPHCKAKWSLTSELETCPECQQPLQVHLDDRDERPRPETPIVPITKAYLELLAQQGPLPGKVGPLRQAFGPPTDGAEKDEPNHRERE